MKCSEIIEMLSSLAPEGCACEWDNPGLLAGRSDKEVRKIYIALDATDQVVEAAIGAGADMLLTHHPLAAWQTWPLSAWALRNACPWKQWARWKGARAWCLTESARPGISGNQ